MKRVSSVSSFLVTLVCSLGLLVVPAQPVSAGLGGGEEPGALPGPSSVWPGGTIHVFVSESFTDDEEVEEGQESQERTIWRALEVWRDRTGYAVRFDPIPQPPADDKERYIHILTPEEFNDLFEDDPVFTGCNSWGPQTEGPTYTVLAAPDCINLPSIIHEIGHAIGLGHEQLRPDRDYHITFEDPWEAEQWEDPNNPPVPWPEDIKPELVGFFDHYSFMHTATFHATPKAPDVVWPLPWAHLGGPSDGDIDTVRALYGFDLHYYSNIAGGDFASFPLARDAAGRQATQRYCQLACAADVRCKAYTYVDIGLLDLAEHRGNAEYPYCFLKSEVSELTANDGLNIHSGTRKPDQECSFGVAFNVDPVGDQISDRDVSMPHNLLNGNTCKDLCAQDPWCEAFTFVPGMDSGTCSKKTHNPDASRPPFEYQRRDGHMSGVIRRAGDPLNLAPASDAGGPYAAEWASDTVEPVAKGAVGLDGTGSSDPEGSRLAHFWTTDCPGAIFDDSRVPNSQLTVYAPHTPPICSTQCNVSLIVTDDQCFRSSRDSATVTIQDTTPPALVGVPADQTLECSAPVPQAAHVTATDGYDLNVVPTFAETRVDGSCAASYTLTRTWTAVDDCGNGASATQIITVQDTTGPHIFCNDDASITPSQAPISFTATATDACGDATVQITGFDCVGKKGKSKLESCVVQLSGSTVTIQDSGGVGDYITWTVQATDSCGNISSRTCDTRVVSPQTRKP